MAGRFDAVLRGPFLGAARRCSSPGCWSAGCCRPAPAPGRSRSDCAMCCSARPACARCAAAWLRWRCSVARALAAAASFSFPAYHFVVLTASAQRGAAVLPVGVVAHAAAGSAARLPRGERGLGAGAAGADPGRGLRSVLRAAPAAFGGLGGVAAFEPRLAAAYAPPALVRRHGPAVPGRVRVHADHALRGLGRDPAAVRPDATRSLRRPHTGAARRAGPGGWAGPGAVLAVAVRARLREGKTLYAAGASYHAYLEFPVLLALLFSYRRTNQGAA